MVNTLNIKEIAEKMAGTGPLFVVDVRVLPGEEIEVFVDSDSSVTIEQCVQLSRAIEAELDREEADFQLTVASAGIGQPLKVLRQYHKLIGKKVEVLFKSGQKLIATLTEATPEELTLTYTEKVLPEGKKRKVDVEVSKTVRMEDIKTTREFIDFK